ncbi:MAG: hypothetical protein VXY42_00970 [Candidatus Thermoplasmatota archaeon]|nr:hypothetical protein [Candidatus Thermoplasmatota archaeon]
MIDDFFVGAMFALFVLVSPFLAIIERLIVALGSYFIFLIVGLIIISSPIFLVSGVVLVLASEATVMSGLFYIALGILVPIVLIPIFSYLLNNIMESDDLIESRLLIPVINTLITLACLIFFGASSTIFFVVLVAASVLTLGDVVINKSIANAEIW